MMVKRIPLDDVCEKKVATLSAQYDGVIDYVDISSVDNVSKRIVGFQTLSAKDAPSRAKQLLEVGDILVSTVRPNLNAVAMVEKKEDNLLVGSTGYCVLRCKDAADRRFIFHFCQSPYFVDDMTAQATGASYPAVTSGIVKNACVPAYPIEEQRQIAEKLDKLSELIALRKEQLAQLDELVKARFVEMFGNNTDSGVPLRDCCIDVRGGGTPSMQHPEYYGGNVPFIKSGDVRGDLVHSGTLWLTEKALSDTPAKFVPKGAVLVVNRSAALLREFRAAIAEQPVVINQDIKAFIPKPEYASEYLLWAIKIQTQYLLTRVTTVLTSHIDLKDLLELKIMPASCEEQALFTQFIYETNKTKLTIQASLDKLEVMKKALMQEYFG